MLKIDKFGFGSAVIDGTKHIRDLILLPDGTIKRRNGGFWVVGSHCINKDEVQQLFASGADMIIIGVGVLSRAHLSDEAKNYAAKQSFDMLILPSRDAVHKWNQLADEGKRAAALIHITC
ncbi:MAG: hypothetical protein E4H40_05620 [Candidatus Brocadiia bacterium]|nr:MAG: hypothetical protein E4H40_05620 [Candidatus Brocadiia bacterium]